MGRDNPAGQAHVKGAMKLLRLTILAVVIGASLTLLVAQAEVHLREVPQALAGDRFDAISLRQNRSGEGPLSLTGGVRGRYSATNVPAAVLVRAAHRVQPTQMIGLPEWASVDRWDVVATIPEGPATADRQMALLRNMLKDRFNLSYHVETRELPVYALVAARGGPRPGLRQASFNCDDIVAGRAKLPPLDSGLQRCGLMVQPSMRMVSTGQSIPGMVGVLTQFVDRLVVDRTGLKDTYEFELRWTPDATAVGLPAPTDPNAPSLFTALEEQLGLRLEPSRAQVEVMVIDRFERPAEN